MNDTRIYFGGSKVRGQIRQLGATSFEALVTSYFNVPFAFPMTRAAFLAHPDRDKLKDIDYICPCTFKDPTGRRAIENAGELVLVILDLDEGAFVKDFAEAPETIADALYPFNFFVYQTAKHTPEAPRLKVVVDVSNLPVGLHRRIVRHIAQDRLGIPFDFKGSRESNVAVQPAYRPMQFEGEPFTAVLASRTNGQAFTEDDLPEETPEESGKRTYAYQGDGDISCGLAYIPIADLKPEDIREALFTIDADCNYKTWCEVIAAMRHQFREEMDAFEAYEMVDEWSSDGIKYRGEKETWSKWRSFRPDAMGRNPSTVRTIFFHAMAAGWENTKVATKIKANVETWLESCDDADELMEEGSKRIASLPFRNDIVEEALVIALQARLRAVTRKQIDKRTIAKEVSRLRHAKRVSEDNGDLPPWLRPWCYIGAERNVFYNIVSGITMSPESFNRFYGKELMPQDENDEQAKTGRPMVAPADFALNVKKIRRVDGATYDPRHGGSEPFFEIEGSSFVNEYRQSSVPALGTPENAKKAGKIIKRHLAILIEEPDYQRLVLDWLAFIVQNPGVKIKWCIVIQSGEGAGKTVIVDWLEAAIGLANIKRVEPGSMEGNFNDWATGAQVTAFEEIWVAGKNRAEVMNKLKQCITNKRVSLNRKFQPVVTVDNISNQIAFTNHHAALHLSGTNRRYFILKSPLQGKAAIEKLMDEKYFEICFALAEKHGGAIRRFLMEHEISKDFDPNGHAPETRYSREMIEESKNPLQSAIEDLIQGEDPRFGDDLIDIAALTEEVAHLARNNHPVAYYLTELNYRNVDPMQKFSVNGHRTAVWVHRERWEEDYGDPVELLRYRTEKWKLQSLD